MSPNTSQVDSNKLPGNWASYLERVKRPHEPNGEGNVLNSGCSQKLAGPLWRSTMKDVKDR